MEPWVEKVSPEAFDVLAANKGSNTVLGGKHLKAECPFFHLHASVDHAMALTFDELSKIPEICLLFIRHNRVCCLFGNGTGHRPDAAFLKVTKELNGSTTLASVVALMDATEVISKRCSA